MFSNLAKLSIASVLAIVGVQSVLRAQENPPTATDDKAVELGDKSTAAGKVSKTEVATFGGGCFWCVEAVFENVNGVSEVVSGYEGGRTQNPNYEQVCSGKTGHAEVCQIKFDPTVISFDELLEIFWKTHDPTTLNRQGPDTGTQYRSVVFYHTPEQKELAEKYKKKLDESGAFADTIVTEISKTRKFYVAEDYHQDYYRLNPNQGYCAAIVRPKVEKFEQAFADKLDKKKSK